MANHKHWSMSLAPVRQLLEMGDTPLKNYMKSEPTISTQKFVSKKGRIYAGSKQTIKHRAVPGQSLLGSSGDWKVSADLPGWYNYYPKIISSQGLQPDIVLWSKAKLKIIVVELSIPYESQMVLYSCLWSIKYEDILKRAGKGRVQCDCESCLNKSKRFRSRHPVPVSESNRNQRA